MLQQKFTQCPVVALLRDGRMLVPFTVAEGVEELGWEGVVRCRPPAPVDESS